MATRLENLRKAVEVLRNVNLFCQKHSLANIYNESDINVDEEELKLSIDGVIFENDLKQMNYLYLIPNNDYKILIQF